VPTPFKFDNTWHVVGLVSLSERTLRQVHPHDPRAGGNASHHHSGEAKKESKATLMRLLFGAREALHRHSHIRRTFTIWPHTLEHLITILKDSRVLCMFEKPVAVASSLHTFFCSSSFFFSSQI